MCPRDHGKVVGTLQGDRCVSKSLELEVVIPGVSLTKLCPVAGPMYSKVTYDKMSPSCDLTFSAVVIL